MAFGRYSDLALALGVVLAAHNYPETPRKGDVISGLPRHDALEDAVVAGHAKGFAVADVTDPSRRAIAVAESPTLPRTRNPPLRARALPP